MFELIIWSLTIKTGRYLQLLIYISVVEAASDVAFNSLEPEEVSAMSGTAGGPSVIYIRAPAGPPNTRTLVYVLVPEGNTTADQLLGHEVRSA